MSYLLEKSLFKDSKYIVKHNGSNVSVTIYDDDTIKDVLVKLAIASKQPVTSDHIYAWVVNNSKVTPLSFTYPSITMDNPYKNKSIDDNFVNSEGNRMLVQLESTMHTIVEKFNSKTILFTTLLDFHKYCNLSYKKKITEDECKEKLGYTREEWFYGKIKKYWPRLKEPVEFFEYSSPPLVSERTKRIKAAKQINEYTKTLMDYVYKEKDPLYPKDYRSYTLAFHNNQEDTTVHLFRLFKDIQLGEWSDTILSFTKITLENYTDTCSKLWKDSIYYTTDDEKRHVSKDLFLKWFRSPVVSVPNTLPRFMDIRNSVTVKLFKDRITATIILYSTGHVKLLLNDLSRTNLSLEFIKEKIHLANQFITYINQKQVYSEDKLQPIKDINESFDICTLQLIYPIKNYKVDKMIYLLNNLSSFVRFNKDNQTTIYAMYKRVDNYESTESKLRVISLLHNSKRGLNRTQIINELTKIFNISEEEAIEEYEQWVTLSEGGKVFQKGENGIEFIIDLQGSNVKVDISSIHSFSELQRIYKFMNFVMKVYDDFIENKKDPYKLFKKKNISLEAIQIPDESEVDLLLDQVPSEREELELGPLEVEDSVVSTRESIDERVASSLSSEESLRLDQFSESRASEPSQASQGSDSSSSDSGMGLLEDSESEGGGYKLTQQGGSSTKEQIGGYNVHRYYLTRLIEYDKKSPHYINDPDAINLFTKYSVNQRKSSKNKSGTQGYTYATKCTPNNHRQPIAISTEDKERFEEQGIGIGVGYREAFNIPDRNPDTWYICPKYWNLRDEEPIPPDSKEYFKFKQGKQLYEGVKGGEVTLESEEKPKTPLKPILLDKYKDKLIEGSVGNVKMKDTDKFILSRSHTYWDKMGQNINNYRLEMIENFHPNGYKIPCCFARKDELKVGWDVEVRLTKDKEYWTPGKIEKITKVSKDKTEYLVTLTGDEIEKVTITNNLNIRRERKSNHVSTNFPSNIGVYGYLNPTLSHYLYPKDLPKIKDMADIQLYRKGIKRGSNKSDKTFLESIQELLYYENSSIRDLIGHIIYDLNQLKNTHNYISAIGGGSFINLFKKNINDITNSDVLHFKKHLKHFKTRFKGTPLERQLKNIKDKDSLINMLIAYRDSPSGIFINREFTEVCAISQFTKYLLSESEIILDKYVSPVLTAIAKFPSRTFGKQSYPNLSIVVFEGNNQSSQDNVILESPMGGFDPDCKSIMLLYKERSHLYEPIMYVKGGYKQTILSLNETTKENEKDEYERLWKNHVINQCKLQFKKLKYSVKPEFITMDKVDKILKSLNLPLLGYVYDNYNKVVLIETRFSKSITYIPVTPCNLDKVTLDKSLTNKFIGDIKPCKYSKYIDFLTKIDKLKLTKPLLPEAKITVEGVKLHGKSMKLVLKEFVFSNGLYLKLKSEEYGSKHKLPVLGNLCLFDIDKNIGLYGLKKDERSIYNKLVTFKSRLRSLFFQKAYLLIKEKQTLMNSILKIKYSEIMIHYHKREKITELIKDLVLRIVIFKGSYLDDLDIDKGSKLIIPSIEDTSSEELFTKLLKLFVDLLINYAERDFDRFLQVDLDLNKIKNSINEGEYLIQYSDIVNDSYLEYFIRYSDYIRNVGVYNEGLSRSKQIQLNNMKQKKQITLERIKEYPEILNTLFGRGILLRNSELSDIDVITTILKPIISEQQEMNSMIIQSLLSVEDINSYRLTPEDLDILSKEYKIGFCMITKQYSKKLYHDIEISIDEHSFDELSESRIVLLYQDDKYLYSIIKNNKDILQIKDIKSNQFKKELIKKGLVTN